MTQVPPGAPIPPKWRQGGAAGPDGTVAKTSRGRKLFWSFAALLALVAAGVGLFMYLSGVAAPGFLALAVREYSSQVLTNNAWAYQDSKLVAKRLGQDADYSDQAGDKILQALGNLRKHDAKPVVVYLSALGRYKKGQVYLLGDDADPDHDDTWVPLAEVLKRMRACPAPGKLLILDIVHLGADSRFGFYTDDIAAKVHDILAKEKNLPFYVLCACSPDQVSYVADELGHSLFAYYLDLGLAGYADGYGPHGSADQRVTVSELAAYVKRHVDRLAWEARGRRQTPILYGQGEDFVLVQLDEPSGEPGDSAAPAVYPDWLRDGWKLRDQWRADIGRLGPGIVRDLDARLLRAEQRWLGGIEEPRLKSEFLNDKQRLEIQAQRITDGRPAPLPRSLPLALDSKKNTPALVDTVRFLLPKALDPNVKIDDKKVEEKAKKEDYDKEVKAVQATLDKQPLEAAQALVEASAAVAKLGPNQVLLLQQMLQNLPAKNPYDQTVFLERLCAFANLVQSNDWDWPMAEVQQALKTMRASESVLADVARDPALLPWVSDDWKKADDWRRAGEKRLFGGLVEPMAWTKANQELKEAESQYAEIQIRVQGLHKARVVYDRAYGLLPNLAPILLARPGASNAQAKIWKDAVQAAFRLADALARPGADVGTALEVATDLNQNLDDLERTQESKVKRRLAQREDGLGEDYLDCQAILESAWLDGQRREALWSAGQKLDLKLLGRVQKQDKAETMGQPQDLAPPAAGQSPDAGAAKKWRWRQAIDMLQLAGSTGVAALEKDYQAALTSNQEDAWSSVEEKISGLWPSQPLEEFKRSEGNLVRADRLVRVLSPFDLAAVRSTLPGHWSQNPGLAQFRKDLAAFWRWQAKRYQADSADQEEGSPFRAVYRQWGEEYAGMAAGL
jgi:hypothetical protein